MDNEKRMLVLGKLKNTARCRPEIEQTSTFLEGLDLSEYEEIINTLIDTNEDQALGILLDICAVNKVMLTPELLVETLESVEPIHDFAAPFCMQDQSVIEPLLEKAATSKLSIDRQLFALCVAVELTVRFKQDPKPVKKALLKIANLPIPTENRLIVNKSLEILEMEEIPEDLVFMSTRPVLEYLPQEKPPVVIGGSYSVRRPIPKLGRNDPCHCGSGKKYKKCCLAKDQELMRDASPYEGVTMTELKSRPGLVDEPGIIEQMKPHELKNLDVSGLGINQLYMAYRCCTRYDLFDQALSMLGEIEKRPGTEFDPGHYKDLMESALFSKDLEFARKIREIIPDDQIGDLEELDLRFDLLDKPDLLNRLESLCRRSMSGDEDESNNQILGISYALEDIYPALSIIFSRATIMEDSLNYLDHDMLLEVIHKSRIDLDLDPWNDPVEEFIDWLYDKKESEQENSVRKEELDELREKVSEARKLAAKQQNEIRDREKELNDLKSKLRENEKVESSPAIQKNESSTGFTSDDQQKVARLRNRIENLKQDISAGQEERRALQQKIKNMVEQAQKQTKKADEYENGDSFERDIEFEPGDKNVLFPEFSSGYKENCKNIPGNVVLSSLKAAGAFAGHDRAVWRQTKSLTGLQNIYSIRVGIHYRLMIRWEKDKILEVLDLIPREQLKTWVKSFRK